MLFTSIHFLIFFIIVIFLYFSIPHRYRWILLLIGSYYFYMSWNVKYIILIIISTLIDYSMALLMGKSKTLNKRKFFLCLSLFSNLGLLFAFKYFNFFAGSFENLLGLFSIQFSPPLLKVLLPVGISFYTFQTLGYIIDVYRKKIKPEKHLGIFAVYVSFFPQLVAGPIERAKNLLPQFLEKHNFDYENVTNGLKLMLWGFFKKLVIADRLAMSVDMIFGNITDYTGIPLILGSIFFSFQIYCDFSGYSDIAIGAAQIMGIKLMDNFKRPYFSKSMSEFWKRWHISLSSWFKDYLYIPLGGRKVKISRWFFNLSIVFLISGLWHGANWTFIAWGALHGFYLIFGIITHKIRFSIIKFIRLDKFPKIHNIIKLFITFNLINFAFIFFRADSISDAIYIITHLFPFEFKFSGINIGFGWIELIISIFLILFLIFINLIEEHKNMRHFLSNKPIWLRWIIYLTIILLILLLGIFQAKSFIYFQF